jgi:sec-independent protein translocase protein TatC
VNDSLATGTSESPTLPKMGLMEHLHELRKRLFYSAIAISITSIFAFSYSTELFKLLAAPLYENFPPNSLIGTGPAEAFMMRMTVSVFGGIILSIPVLFYQLWMFISPGLYSSEKKIILPIVLVSSTLFIMGALLAYYGVLPIAFSFFNDQYKEIGLTPQIRISEHLSVVATSVLALGFLFELPILCFFMARLGILTAEAMKRTFRYAIVGIFIVAAIASPPDVLSQFLIAIPLFVLYSVSYFVVTFAEKKAAAV